MTTTTLNRVRLIALGLFVAAFVLGGASQVLIN